MPLLYFVQHSQSVPFSLTQSDALRFHGPPATHESGHFYFAQTGNSHFAATYGVFYLDKRDRCRKNNAQFRFGSPRQDRTPLYAVSVVQDGGFSWTSGTSHRSTMFIA